MSKSSRADECTLGAPQHVDKREFFFLQADSAQITGIRLCHGFVTIPLRDCHAGASMLLRLGGV